MLAGLLAGLLARAPSASADRSEVDTAKQEYALGWQALQAGDYAQALEHYERSFALVPRPRTLFNIAVAEEKLGRLRDALLHYMEFVERAEARDHEFVEQAQRRLVELKKVVLGRLEIISKPAGAAVYLDDSEISSGRTPVMVELAAGSHRVKVVAPGVEPVVRAVEVVAGRQGRERFTLVAPAARTVAKPDQTAKPPKTRKAAQGAGLLVIHSNVAGATVSVDGMVVGTTSLANPASGSRPALRHPTPWGRHTVMVERPGVSAWRRQLHISPNEMVMVEVDFRHRHPERRRLIAWGLAGLGSVSLVVGGTFGVLAIRDVTQPTSDDHDRGKSRALVSDLLMVGGAVAILGGWWLERKPATSGEVERSYMGE